MLFINKSTNSHSERLYKTYRKPSGGSNLRFAEIIIKPPLPGIFELKRKSSFVFVQKWIVVSACSQHR